MSRRKDRQFQGPVSRGFGGGVERVARDDESGGVGGGAAGLGDATACAGREGEERGEVGGCVFFDESEDGGDLVDVGLAGGVSGLWDGGIG